ncbi:expressed unknown protein [Seminavis robusta]|uniref:Fe2OG dioxygenase domain-containing protein n=1 Tax=Seminavis robusta TaxID=568900 RepID=A0A9N8HD70_9STRA|nr:expressed unknown protein [Seminavis robusta]|eukprot:Sro412_g137810.1 n/a (282) ;mRNA; r:17873-18718
MRSARAFLLVLGFSSVAGIVGTGTCTTTQEQESTEPLPVLKQYNSRRRREAVQASLHAAQRGSGTVVKSHFIQDEETLLQLADPQLWTKCVDHQSEVGLRFLPAGEKPKNVWEEIALLIWQDHPVVTTKNPDNTPSFAGFEYWCNIITPGDSLDWHVDKDEALGMESNTMVNPIFGAVYYGFPHRFTGGYLELLPVDPQQSPSAEEYYWKDGAQTNQDNGFVASFERIEAQYNRLVLFNVSKWHRVSAVTRGARFTFAVNLWKEKPRKLHINTVDPKQQQA